MYAPIGDWIAYLLIRTTHIIIKPQFLSPKRISRALYLARSTLDGIDSMNLYIVL